MITTLSLFSLLQALLVVLVSANTDKIIFIAPDAVPIPLSRPNFSDLKLDVLSPENWSIRRNLSRSFPDEPKGLKQGTSSWFLLDDLKPGQRYELRVCWSAIQPTAFYWEEYELSTVWETPELIQSLSEYAYSRIALLGEDQEEPQAEKRSSSDEVERHASVILVRIIAAADYYTDNAALMRDPPPVLVDLILDPFLYNVLPRSLVPTVGYIVVISIISWYVARWSATKLRAIAIPPESVADKQK